VAQAGLTICDQPAPLRRKVRASLACTEIGQRFRQVLPTAQAVPSGAALTAFRTAAAL